PLREEPSPPDGPREQEGENDRQRKVDRHPRERDENVPPPVAPEVPRIDRHRLRPPEDEAAGQHQQDRGNEDATDRIDVRNRVQRQPPQHRRRRVPLATRHPPVRYFVEHDREDENRQGGQ